MLHQVSQHHWFYNVNPVIEYYLKLQVKKHNQCCLLNHLFQQVKNFVSEIVVANRNDLTPPSSLNSSMTTGREYVFTCGVIEFSSYENTVIARNNTFAYKNCKLELKVGETEALLKFIAHQFPRKHRMVDINY